MPNPIFRTSEINQLFEFVSNTETRKVLFEKLNKKKTLEEQLLALDFTIQFALDISLKARNQDFTRTITLEGFY